MECIVIKLTVFVALMVCVACVPTPFRLERSCHIDDFQLQENFSLERFMGTWYAVAHVQRTDYPYQRRSHYALREDGTISMKTNRVMRPGDCNSWHFEASGQIDEESNHPAKMWLYPPMPNYPPENYWVVSTDYITYAVVYSCSQQKQDGSCTRRGEHAWLMGRVPGGMSQQVRAEVSEMMSALCIRPERLNDVPLDCDKELRVKPDPLTASRGCLEDRSGTCSDGQSNPNPCTISSFEVQQDFIVEKFLGEWYEIAHTRHRESLLKLPDMKSMLFRRGTPGQDAHMALLMKDLKIDGLCTHIDMPGSGWLNDDNPAKITVHFPIPEEYGVSGSVRYWILSTDYTSYAVTYSCHLTNDDGTCDRQREVLWVLSRTPSLPEGVERRVDQVIRGTCLDPVQVIQNQDVCFTAERGEGNTTVPIIMGKAAVTNGCDPELAKFGCCLLNDQPATGPNFEGCPRVYPPIAGQHMDSGPVSDVERRQPIALALSMGPEPLKVKTVECDEKIICKKYCKHSFKRDKDNCPICQCSEESQETTTKSPANEQQATSDPTGQIQHEAARNTKMVSCLHQQAKTSSKYGIPVLECELDGSFTQIQCHGEECWCVDQTTGFELKSTRVSHNTKPDCSQDITTPSKQAFSKMTSDCPARHREAELSLDEMELSGSIFLPTCDERGLYDPVQCYLGSDVCWCVDKLTGEQVADSVAQGQQPMCSL